MANRDYFLTGSLCNRFYVNMEQHRFCCFYFINTNKYYVYVCSRETNCQQINIIMFHAVYQQRINLLF